MSKQPQMIVVDFEIELDKYQLTDYGISEATSIYCSLITEEKYSNYQEMDNLALLELSAKEDKALRRFVDKDLKTKILQYKKKQMRPLLMLDAIMETVKELIMNYSEKHSYLSLAEIAVTGDVTTFQNPEFENTLNSLTLEAKQALIDSLGFESDDELVDYLMNLYDDPFGLDFDAFDDEDDDYDDDEGGSVIFHDFGDDRWVLGKKLRRTITKLAKAAAPDDVGLAAFVVYGAWGDGLVRITFELLRFNLDVS